jgi:HSP20 family molecular chaperone IbpA
MATNDKQVQKQESKDLQSAERTRWGKVFSPAVDIMETKNDLRLFADMPGVDQKSINITVDQGVLTIQGNVDTEPIEGYELDYQEYDVGDYQRTFTLTDSVDQDKISANFNNGVLELTLPKAEEAKPKKIDIKVN